MRGQVLRSVVAEAVLVGAIASAVGLGGGRRASPGCSRACSTRPASPLPAGGIVVTGGTVVVALAVGMVVTLIAGVFPAIKASRVAPLAALRDVAVERTTPSRGRVVAGIAAGRRRRRPSRSSPPCGDADMLAFVGLGAVLTVVGAVVLGPVAARPAAVDPGRAASPGCGA